MIIERIDLDGSMPEYVGISRRTVYDCDKDWRAAKCHRDRESSSRCESIQRTEPPVIEIPAIDTFKPNPE